LFTVRRHSRGSITMPNATASHWERSDGKRRQRNRPRNEQLLRVVVRAYETHSTNGSTLKLCRRIMILPFCLFFGRCSLRWRRLCGRYFPFSSFQTLGLVLQHTHTEHKQPTGGKYICSDGCVVEFQAAVPPQHGSGGGPSSWTCRLPLCEYRKQWTT
jgi:hypothetical protein